MIQLLLRPGYARGCFDGADLISNPLADIGSIGAGSVDARRVSLGVGWGGADAGAWHCLSSTRDRRMELTAAAAALKTS
jgi:hypothetical protein